MCTLSYKVIAIEQFWGNKCFVDFKLELLQPQRGLPHKLVKLHEIKPWEWEMMMDGMRMCRRLFTQIFYCNSLNSWFTLNAIWVIVFSLTLLPTWIYLTCQDLWTCKECHKNVHIHSTRKTRDKFPQQEWIYFLLISHHYS